MNKITTLAVLVGLAVLAVPPSVLAQCLDVTPASWDYGDVKIGTGESQIFTLNNCADTEVFIGVIEITDDSNDAFHIASAPTTPFFIPGWGSEEVEVTFTPPDVGAHEAFLHVRSDDPGEHTYVNLSGVGVKRWRCVEAKAAP